MGTQNFTELFLTQIKPGDHILDIGGGEGKFALQFIERGARVTIVDPKADGESSENITVVKKTIEEFCAELYEEKYDAMFARNVIQFLDRSWVFESLIPWMTSHLRESGTIALKTFFRDPEPPFARPVPSLFELRELQRQFLQWNELLAAQYEHRGSDMQGIVRQFFTVDVIIKKSGSPVKDSL